MSIVSREMHRDSLVFKTDTTNSIHPLTSPTNLFAWNFTGKPNFDQYWVICNLTVKCLLRLLTPVVDYIFHHVFVI